MGAAPAAAPLAGEDLHAASDVAPAVAGTPPPAKALSKRQKKMAAAKRRAKEFEAAQEEDNDKNGKKMDSTKELPEITTTGAAEAETTNDPHENKGSAPGAVAVSEVVPVDLGPERTNEPGEEDLVPVSKGAAQTSVKERTRSEVLPATEADDPPGSSRPPAGNKSKGNKGGKNKNKGTKNKQQVEQQTDEAFDEILADFQGDLKSPGCQDVLDGLQDAIDTYSAVKCKIKKACLQRPDSSAHLQRWLQSIEQRRDFFLQYCKTDSDLKQIRGILNDKISSHLPSDTADFVVWKIL
ncbi:unnamed protein product, partial [Amoebophrya sp. A120]|eukprot:GSA120T00003596001.1